MANICCLKKYPGVFERFLFVAKTSGHLTSTIIVDPLFLLYFDLTREYNGWKKRIIYKAPGILTRTKWKILKEKELKKELWYR